MASALEKILKGTLQKSDAQKAFRPWWEDVGDKALYATMILGMITLPFNMVSNTPVECTLDQVHPAFENLSIVDQSPMRYHHFYLRKFCTMNFINDWMIFLPFLLILCPLPLVGIERMCLRVFGVLKRMNAFYTLLVKESLDREDVEALALENTKNSHELQQMFRDSNGVYFAFVTKSIIQLLLGCLIDLCLLYVHWFALSPEMIPCRVFSQHYLCVVPLARFYSAILVVAMWAMGVYVVCTLYTLLWIRFPAYLNPFHRFMRECFTHVEKCITAARSARHSTLSGDTDTRGGAPLLAPGSKGHTFFHPEDDPRQFFDVFFDEKSRDLSLLITLLACSNGVADGLRLVALFGKHYQRLWKPLDTQITHVPNKEGVIRVEWNDAPLASFVHNRRGQSCNTMKVEYTLEILPPTSEAPLRSRQFHGANELEFKYSESFHGVELDYPRKPQLAHQPFSIHTLDNYEPSDESASVVEYLQTRKSPKCDIKIVISSEINGRTIAQITEHVPPPPYLPDRKSALLHSPLARVASCILEEASVALPKACQKGD